MLTPEQIQDITETMQPYIDELNVFITRDIVKRLMARMKHDDILKLSATDVRQVEIMRDAGAHYETVQAEIRRWTNKTDAEVRAIFEDAGIKAWDADRKIYEAAGNKTAPIYKMPRMVQLMADTCQRTNGTIHNFTRTTAHASQKRLIQLLDTAHIQTMSGALSYSDAYRQAINSIATTQLVVAYGDVVNGSRVRHEDTIETAILRAVRTGTNQACSNISLQGMIDLDWDIIQVSSHLGARYGDGGENASNHFWWQGKQYSRTGRTPNLPLFYVCGYGTGDGICGWNCRHSMGPGRLGYNPFENYDKEENKKVYDLSQKQRKLELKIRKLKLEVAARDEAVQSCPDSEKDKYTADLDAAVTKLKDRVKGYTDFCKENNLKPQWVRLEVAQYNRISRNRTHQN